MTTKESKKKIISITLTILLILLVTTAIILTSGFTQSNIRINSETIINQGLQQSVLPVSIKDINETNNLNATSSYYNNTLETLNTDPVPLDTLNSTIYNYPDMSGFFFSPSYNVGQDQITGSNPSDNSLGPPIAVPILLDSSKFVTYTYGGYSVQQPDSTQFIFSFPD
jgi:hypothetical protein